MSTQYYSRYDRGNVHLLIAQDEYGICGIWFEGAKRYGKGLCETAAEQESELIVLTKHWLDRYFRGERPEEKLPLHLSGTPFQLAVWEQLQKIPYGKTVTYGKIAEALGRPKGAQAVGQAVGANPISVIVPCHRVIAKDGSLTGYDGGLENKKMLLRTEGIPFRQADPQA